MVIISSTLGTAPRSRRREEVVEPDSDHLCRKMVPRPPHLPALAQASYFLAVNGAPDEHRDSHCQRCSAIIVVNHDRPISHGLETALCSNVTVAGT